MSTSPRADEERTLTFAELAAQAERVGCQLLAAGLEPGDRVGIVVADPELFVRLFYGALRVGVVPVPFVRDPALWLRSLSTQRATLTFAPNFAYAMTTARAATIEGIDLSTVRLWGCGAEPIQPDTLRAFVKTFARVGARESAVFPSYGTAEATLAMAFSGLGDGLRTDWIDREAYLSHRVARPAGPGASSLEVVACGRAMTGHKFEVWSESDRPLPERCVGELVFSGPSAAGGYHEAAEATAAAFTPRGLRTGDLGYIADGCVHVTGRKKDIVILNGRNYDPQTLERAATL